MDATCIGSSGPRVAVAEPAGPRHPGTGIIRSTVGRPVTVLYVVPEGTTVKEGDLLVELDDAALVEEMEQLGVWLTEARVQLEVAEETLWAAKQDAGAAVELAEEHLAVAKLAFAAFVDGEYPLQIADAEGALELAEERRAVAAQRVDRLNEQSAESRDAGDLEQAGLAVTEATSMVAAATRQLHFLKDIWYAHKESVLQLAIAEKEFALSRAKNEAQRAARETEGALEVARARFEMEQSRSERLEAQIGASKRYAPSAGMVLYLGQSWGGDPASTGIEAGVVVHHHQPLVQVTDMKRFKLAVPVRMEVAQRVEIGREVSIRVDAFPNRTFTGRVAEMRVVPKAPSGVAEGLLIVTVEDTNARLRPGMSAKIEIEL